MGCFPIPKNKNKVAAASQHADQQQQSKSYGAKLEQLLSSNKPVVLPDPDDLSGEQPKGTRPVPPSAGIRGGGNWQQQQQQQSQPTGKTGGTKSGTKTSSNNNPSSKLINHHPCAVSAPVSFSTSCASSEDSNHQCPPIASHHSRNNSRFSFSAPLCSRIPLDGSSSPSAVSPTATAAAAVSYSSPLHSMAPASGLRDATNRSTSSQSGMDKKVTKARARKSLAGKPTRLPTPQATAAHPLPLPHPSELDDIGAAAPAGSGMGTGLPSSGGGFACVPPSPSRGKDGLGHLNVGFRLPGGGISGEALPLPPPALPTHSRTPVRAFPYSELAHALMPDCFLCDGLYGRAYKATIDDHGDSDNKIKEVVVVCPFVKALQGLSEWLAEVNWLARLQDPHLCKLLGYCVEDVPCLGTRRLLVYEFMNNGSLDKHLTGKDNSRHLDWSTRMSVALDVAQGLAYLHDKAPFQVICRDLSLPSIHLNKDLRAKLCGFGLARCGPDGDHGVVMTGPYAAPESAETGVVTMKSNAWSFGVVLLELLTGRRHMDPNFPSQQRNLIQFTKPFLRDEGKLFLILDRELMGRYSGRGALKVANLAFQCLMKEASLRPNLSDAVEVLKVVQTDEESLTGDLKKSRSLTQSVGSPVVYSRSSSDHFVQRSCNSVSSISSPATEAKQRERDFLKMALVPGSSSPSYAESRLSVDHRHQKSYFNDRDAQKLPVFSNNLEGAGERDLQKLPTVHGSGGCETTPSTSSSTSSSSALYSDSGLGGARKSTSYGAVSPGLSAVEYRQASSPVHVHARGGDSKKLQSQGLNGHVPRSGSKFRDFENLTKLHIPETSLQTNENKQQGREFARLHAQQTSGTGQNGEIKHQATTDTHRLTATEPSLLVSTGGGGELKLRASEGSLHSLLTLPPNAAGEGKQQYLEERKSSTTHPSSYFFSAAELKASIDCRRSGEFCRGDMKLSGEFRPARSELRLSGELRRPDFRRRELRLSGELRRIDPKTVAELRRSDFKANLEPYRSDRGSELRRAEFKYSGEHKRSGGEFKAQASEARLLSGGGVEALQPLPMPVPMSDAVPDAVEPVSGSPIEQNLKPGRVQLRPADTGQQHLCELSEQDQKLLPTLPIPAPPSLSSSEPTSETSTKHDEEFKSPSPAGANAGSSCAPPLTFDPPVIRKEFCVW